MRARLVTNSLSLALLAAAPAADVPRGTYAPADLEEAMEEAQRSGKAVALLFLDDGASQEQHIEQNRTALRGVKSFAEIVYVDVKGADITEYSPPIFTVLQDPTVGALIPKCALMAPDLSEMWSKFSAVGLTEESSRRTLSNVRKEVAEKLDGWRAAEGAGNPLTRSYKWALEENKYSEGTFDSYDGELLTLIDKKTNRPNSIEKAKLRPGSVAFAEKLAKLKGDAPAVATATADAPDAPDAPAADSGGGGGAMETWTSSDGRTLQAKFVALKDGKVALELEGGKQVVVPLSRLSKESVKRAQALDAEDAFGGG